MKAIMAQSDVFSLGVVCYETLTKRRPFEGSTETQVIDAILHQIPPPASDLNPAVSQLLSRVVHKAMAKQAWYRFSTARELAETLQKALRNERIEVFDPARLQPRIQRATKAFEQADYEFAGEILTELESEGHLDPAISDLRQKINQAVRQKKIRQLLESARIRMEEGEDPLALQKVEEVLQLDPANLTALTLKSKIESRRNEGQIEDWLRLAQKHIDNHTYGHAREALQNVLHLKPKETRALQLLAEVDRQEQEYLRVRQEKRQLYQSALEAWHNGDVSNALSKMGLVLELDRRAPDTTSPEGVATYQNFYNQVRSEHDAINSGYAEARKHLADRNFAKALAVCDQYLAKYPGHALFQALKFDVEVQQRQQLSAYIAEVDRWVDAEPDVEKRVSILGEAIKLYPDEPHFQRSLRLETEKRDLVASIVTKARLCEERSQFSEALAQWEILKTIYSQYPGLSFEMERVTKRRDQQLRSEAKARWVEQIDRCLEAGEYARALDLLQKAQSEFLNDAELAELEKLAQQGAERAAQAQQLLAQGQDHCAQGRLDQGLECLSKAHQLDERNLLVRAVLLDTLVEQARSVLETDWRTAEALAQQALELDPNHALAKSLRTLALDRKREEFVDACLSQVRHSQAAGDPKGALAQLEQGLAAYPTETRLIQARDTLRKDTAQPPLRQARHRDLEELRRLEHDAGATADPETVRSLFHTATALVGRYPDDAEFQSLATSIGRRLETVNRLAESQAGSKAAEDLSNIASGAVAEMPPRVDAAQQGGQIAEVLNVDARAHFLRTFRSVLERLQNPRWLMAATGLATVVVVGGLLYWWWKRHPQQPPPPPPPPSLSMLDVDFTTNPPGATLRIDEQDQGTSPKRLKLTEGSHQVEALMEGYQPFSKRFTVPHASAAPINLTLALQPLALKLQLLTKVRDAQVELDGQPAGDVVGGSWVLESVGPGTHTLKISGRDSETTVSFEAVPADVPVLSSAPTTKNSRVVTVSTFTSRGFVQFSFKPGKMINMDDQPLAEWESGGLKLTDLAIGTHTLAWDKSQIGNTFESDSAPVLTIFLEPENANSANVITSRPKPPPPLPPPPPEPQIAKLQRLAREAYTKGNYIEPPGESAVDYLNAILKLDPTDQWAKDMIGSSVKAQRSVVLRAAINSKDFTAARQTANVLKTRFPDRNDGEELDKDITNAETALRPISKEQRPADKPTRFRVSHKHLIGSCHGLLTIGDGRIEYQADDGKDSFNALLKDITYGLVSTGGGFHLHPKGGKDWLFHSDNAPDILRMLEQASKAH